MSRAKWDYINEQLGPLAELKDAPEILNELEKRRVEFERLTAYIPNCEGLTDRGGLISDERLDRLSSPSATVALSLWLRGETARTGPRPRSSSSQGRNR